MSSEESYLAIIRYLTDEQEPYAPGTSNNTKRKIRKAAACYVVRNGVLYYQRRLKGQNAFTELEVVLQDSRRKELIDEAHVTKERGEHLNQQLTWETISQTYWWRGILKQVKDHIKACGKCQSKRGTEDVSGFRLVSRSERGKEIASDENFLLPADSSPKPIVKISKTATKHELVFVDSKGEVNQFLSKHSQTMLEKLNRQRLSNQFCDITLLIEGEEFRAHKAVLAACSDYFHELFFEKGAASTHEAVVDLSGFSKASFLPLLDFAYTSTLTFNFCIMADIANLARHLLMTEVLQICEHVHKQVEEKKIKVYQKGDTVMHTVMSSQQPPEEDSVGVPGAYVVTLQDDGQTVVTQGGVAVAAEPLAFVETPEGAYIQQQMIVAAPVVAAAVAGEEEHHGEAAQDDTVTLITQGAEVQPGETVTLITGGTEGMEAETMTVVTHSGQAGASESLAMVSACLAKVKKDVQPEAAPLEEELPSADESQGEQQEATSHDRNRRRLRQRSIAEGGYARLHMGLEDEEEESAAPPRAVTPKVGPRQGKRGRPPKHPVQSPEEETQAEAAVSGEHTCPDCGMSFDRRYSLIMHTLKHEKSRGYKCNLCHKEFQYAASLRPHLARHKQQSSHRVALSKPTAAQISEGKGDGELEDKAQLPHTKREFVCDICGKTLPKLYSLRIHMLNHTGVRPHSCKVCGKSFTNKHSLSVHRTLHGLTKQFQCEYCKKLFVSKRSMEDHTSLHTGESKYLCNTCGETFHRASALSKHLKKHQPKPTGRAFACVHCDKRFYEAKDLQQHMNKHMGLKPFQCQVCGKCYSWKKDWYSHVKSHSVAEPFKCNVCGKEFYEKALFRRHVKKATHGKKGRVKQNLVRECEQCGRKFTQLREYRRHVNNHQGVKPFECLTCGVAWADARSLKRHVRTHTGERPYVCPLCQEAHIDARTLRKHMAKYHVDNLPGKIMLEKDTLQFHNQGTQVEHAVSILASDLPPELRPAQHQHSEEIETVLITEETVETMEAVQAAGEGSVATLSDQGIMQVVNYVLAQHALTESKPEGTPELIQTMEVEVAHVAEVE
uniref:Zinc finger and BTB domain containing 11 n=1 Tax=Tetraodon nigroviridis TaxID=99883 RepID=H3D8D6_TETNG